MKRLFSVLAAFCFLFLIHAQTIPQNIKISVPAKVKIIYSKNFSVKVKDSTTSRLYVVLFDTLETSNSNPYFPDIKILKNNNTLYIRSATGAVNYLDILPEIIIYLPEVDTLWLTSAAQIFITGNFNLDHLTLINTGAGFIRVDKSVKIQNLYVDNQGAGVVRVNSSFPVSYAKINISGVAMFSAPNTPIANLDAQISGASYCNINVTHNLIAKVTGFSVLDYNGHPEYKKIISLGLVIVNQKNNKFKTL